MFRDQFQRMVEVALALVALSDGALPESAFFVTCRRDRLDDREGQFALAEIVAKVLAGGAGVAAIVEQVVGDLEGDAERVAVCA